MSEVEPNEKVIVGEIRFVGGDLGDWTSGLFLNAWPLFTNGRQGDGFLSGRGGSLPSKGGVFHVAVGKEHQVHLAGISVQSTLIFVNVNSFLPLFLKLHQTSSACDYVGTIIVSKRGQRIFAKVVDTFGRDKAAYVTYVKGCDLKNAVDRGPEEEEDDEAEDDEDDEDAADDDDEAPTPKPTPMPLRGT
jgi:hypothetical protein